MRLSVPTIRHSPIGSGPHISTCHFAPGFERAAILSFSRSFCGKLSSAGRRSPSRNTARRRARAPLAGGRHHETTRWRSWQFSLRAIIRRPYSHHGCLLSISTFEHNELRSCGGVVVSNLKHGSANLGNFLSSPNHRRRGLAGAVASTLIHDLEAEGLYTFVLATTEENVPARRTYERLGFHVVETRPQVDLCAPGL